MVASSKSDGDSTKTVVLTQSTNDDYAKVQLVPLNQQNVDMLYYNTSYGSLYYHVCSLRKGGPASFFTPRININEPTN
ncbi:hypothetical protein HNO89_003673 [Sporosarcina luteola]|nr:hypothetical protein [Sporosarcina luteola]